MSGIRFPVSSLVQMATQRVSRRAGIGVAAAALVALAAPAPGEAKSPKKQTFCLNGEVVKAKHKKKKHRLRSQGATRGACPTPGGCPSGQTACNGACIADTACCTDADCTSPATCKAGVCASPACGTGGTCTVFMTSGIFTGALGGLSGGDAKCQAAAIVGGLTGTYKAWLGDASGTPATTFSNTASAGPYVLVSNNALDNGNPPPTVAATFAALTTCAGNCLQHAINRDETGATADTFAWTGVKSDGTVATATCSDWTVGAIGTSGRYGYVVAKQSTWTDFNLIACSNGFRLYCFEQATS
ncbi:MAG: DUF1554 domain-containing protein [Thermomicrobiales bacterium]